MIVSNDKTLKDNFCITVGGKQIKHKNQLEILGYIMEDTLCWNAHERSNVIPQLANRARTIKHIARYQDPTPRKN